MKGKVGYDTVHGSAYTEPPLINVLYTRGKAPTALHTHTHFHGNV